MNYRNMPLSADALAGLEARFGLRIAASLSEQAENTRHDISERLRFAREQALLRAKPAAQAVTASGTVALGLPGGAALLGQRPGGWVKWGSVLPLLVLVAGLFLIDHRLDQQQISAAAEVDSALLSDDLPPSAYSDPGFLEFLKTSPN